MSLNVIKKCFGELCEPLKNLVNLSIVERIFPDDLKIAKFTPIYKTDSSSNISNYRPVSVLPYFSKMLERIMYNRLQKYLNNINILYNKQFGFQTGHSTEHAIDLSKTFDTVNHSILLKKLELSGITDRNFAWILNRLQYIQVDENSRTEFCVVKCGVPQGSTLGPLLFLLYVSDI